MHLFCIFTSSYNISCLLPHQNEKPVSVSGIVIITGVVTSIIRRITIRIIVRTIIHIPHCHRNHRHNFHLPLNLKKHLPLRCHHCPVPSADCRICSSFNSGCPCSVTDRIVDSLSDPQAANPHKHSVSSMPLHLYSAAAMLQYASIRAS